MNRLIGVRTLLKRLRDKCAEEFGRTSWSLMAKDQRWDAMLNYAVPEDQLRLQILASALKMLAERFAPRFSFLNEDCRLALACLAEDIGADNMMYINVLNESASSSIMVRDRSGNLWKRVEEDHWVLIKKITPSDALTEREQVLLRAQSELLDKRGKANIYAFHDLGDAMAVIGKREDAVCVEVFDELTRRWTFSCYEQ